MPMAKYQSPGTANLRVVPQTKMAPAPTLPSAGGTPVGGTDNLRAESRTLMAGVQPTPVRNVSVDIPPGLQSFNDDQVR